MGEREEDSDPPSFLENSQSPCLPYKTLIPPRAKGFAQRGELYFYELPKELFSWIHRSPLRGDGVFVPSEKEKTRPGRGGPAQTRSFRWVQYHTDRLPPLRHGVGCEEPLPSCFLLVRQETPHPLGGTSIVEGYGLMGTNGETFQSRWIPETQQRSIDVDTSFRAYATPFLDGGAPGHKDEVYPLGPFAVGSLLGQFGRAGHLPELPFQVRRYGPGMYARGAPRLQIV
jgi:hypothetical protein